MQVKELRELYRNQFEDKVADQYFLSDALFLDYLNEAQEEACLRANLIFDKSSSFCAFAVTSGANTWLLDDSIYAIVYASLTNSSGVATSLRLIDRIELDRLARDWRTNSGTPTAFIHYDTTIELSPSPDTDYTLKIECFRLPEDKLAGPSDEPEIHRTHHRNLIYWVLYRAYSTPDVDMANADKAAFFEKKFASIFGARPDANSRRKQYANRPHRNKAYF